MKLDIVANSGNDEFYTPAYAIHPIINYLKQKRYVNVWCPFDTENSFFVKLLTEAGFNVIYTHISTGDDFFKTDTPENIDVIVSNPPYSIKGKVIENCFNRKKPFALLVGVVGLFESKFRFNMFKDNDFEILYFDKRIAYFKSYEEIKPSLNPPFSSVFICSKVLPDRICFSQIVR